MILISQRFSEKYPEAHAGILIMRDVQNPVVHPELEKRKRLIETDLQTRFSATAPQILEATPPLPAYTAYYKQFDKTYHVLGQLRSIIFKQKSIPCVAALVETMFMAELKNGMLTAGHDLDRIHGKVTLNVSDGTEHFTALRGVDQTLKPGDMFISDEEGIISCVIYGPDQRSQISPNTKNVLFTVYAPKGVDPLAVKNHLKELSDLVLIVSPQAKIDLSKVFGMNESN